jgi:hypothetical protein
MKSLLQTLAGFRLRKPERLERRSETRLPAHGLAYIRWEVDGEGALRDAVNMLGVSSWGLSFRTARDFALGQKIRVQLEEQEFHAVVRYSAPDGCEFIIGVEIHSRDEEPLEPAAPTGPEADQAVVDHELDSSASAASAAPIESEHHRQAVASETALMSASDDEYLVALSKLDARLAFEKYRRLVLEKTGKNLTKTDFWKEAKCKNRSSFERWQRRDMKTTVRDRENFERILREKPHVSK